MPDDTTTVRAAAGSTGSAGDKRYTVYADEVRHGGTIAWRNNNPGNIRAGDFAMQQGAIGRGWGFAIFPDEATGTAAVGSLLRTPSYWTLSIKAAIAKYAPAADNNDPVAYANRIRNLTGIDPDRVLNTLSDDELGAVVRAIRNVEGWTAGFAYRCDTAGAPDWARDALGCGAGTDAAPSPPPAAAPLDLHTTAGVQEALVTLGYKPGEVDGIDGPMTQGAVKAFQQDEGLVVDGKVGPQTRAALAAALDSIGVSHT